MKTAIGGYFELELPLPMKARRHLEAAAFQSARASIYALLQSARPQPVRLWLPHYICDAVLMPVLQAGIQVSFYGIDRNFEIEDGIFLEKGEWLLYVNYFGICTDQVEKTLARFPADQVIVDCSQAWFAQPVDCLANIYSPRKFFGVPDGGFIYSKMVRDDDFLADEGSLGRTQHLLKRLTMGPEFGYADYQEAEASLAMFEPRRMSVMTRRLLESVDTQKVLDIRNENFARLHRQLQSRNPLNIPRKVEGPLCYPFFSEDESLRKKLLDNRVFVPTYWQDVLKRVSLASMEAAMVKKIIPLPIDQRYGAPEMDRILEIVNA